METYYYVEELPLAIEYGMSIYEFWNEDIDLFYAYQKAYVNKTHSQAHIQGAYFNLAISIALSNAFKGKNDKEINYPKEDVFNPFKQEKTENKNSVIANIDTSKNNKDLYQIKKRIEERRKLNNG